MIDSEMETLPEHATVQEREAVARRLLPILLASENDLYKNDNLQKLALRLRIAERDLLDVGGRSSSKIAAATAAAPAAAAQMPEPPPLSGDEMPDFDTPRADRRGAQRGARICTKLRWKPTACACCCMQPKLIYDVNRKFRELAEDNPALADGPLGDLSSDDFTRTSYRALMDVFLRAIAQDEHGAARLSGGVAERGFIGRSGDSAGR